MQTQRISTANGTIGDAFLIPTSRGEAAEHQLNEFFTIGRGSGNNLVLNDPFVSSRHARIEKKGYGYVLRDLGSVNGTYVNGSRITEICLSWNDKIRFGESVYTFSEQGQNEPHLQSRNPSWQEQLQRLPTFAATDFSVLICGPSGSGKEVLARWIHRASGRSRGPFTAINCSALGESLIESELFGHVRGSFTGATHDRKGAFESARGGTLFLDEIGDLPLQLQPKLLRALENQEIRPVGSDRTLQTDVRVIAATHKNLPLQVSRSEFREDLYYRLNICRISPPALAERLEDFEDLVYQFSKQQRVRLSHNSILRMKAHPWEGNVRELKNAVARLAAYYPGQHIQPEHVEKVLDRRPVWVPAKAEKVQPLSVVKELEREMILQRLALNRGNQRKTAADLGIPKSTLHDRIKNYSIDIDQIPEV